MLKGIHNTKVHKDCPFDIETLDEFRNDLLNVATANGCPVHPSWAAGHQRHYARQTRRHTDRLRRLKQLHAMALGLYMGFRLNGQDGQAQKQRMERLAKEIQRLDPTIESVQSVQSVVKQPTFLTRQDMERIAEQDIDPALLPSDEIARKIEENDIHISVTTNNNAI